MQTGSNPEVSPIAHNADTVYNHTRRNAKHA